LVSGNADDASGGGFEHEDLAVFDSGELGFQGCAFRTRPVQDLWVLNFDDVTAVAFGVVRRGGFFVVFGDRGGFF
jgi:hypothetical protein